jgi:hypothetical protein
MRQRLPRIEYPEHLAFVRDLPCASCLNDLGADPAHLRAANRRWGKDMTGGGRKPSDIWVMPLCRSCHDKQHRMNEVQFWQDRGIDPWRLALSLFAASGNRELALEVISAQCRT